MPFIANLKPSGKYVLGDPDHARTTLACAPHVHVHVHVHVHPRYVMEDLHAVGGTPGVLKYMLEQGHLHGDCMTVTGKTMAENLADLPGELVSSK